MEANCLRFEPKGDFTTLGDISLRGYFLGSYSAPPAPLAATRGRGREMEMEERDVKGGRDKKKREGVKGKREGRGGECKGNCLHPLRGDRRPWID